MRIELCTFLFLCLLSCKTQSNLSAEIDKPIVQKASTGIDGYESTIALIPNKRLEFKSDTFNNTYAEEHDGTNFILKYELVKKQDPKLPDGRYSEIVYAELPENFRDIFLENEGLQSIKLHSAKFCFCENANSYQPITTGVIQLLQGKKKELRLRLDFKPKKGSHKITSISEVIFLN